MDTKPLDRLVIALAVHFQIGSKLQTDDDNLVMISDKHLKGHTHSKLISCLLLIFMNMEIGQKEMGTTHTDVGQKYTFKKSY